MLRAEPGNGGLRAPQIGVMNTLKTLSQVQRRERSAVGAEALMGENRWTQRIGQRHFGYVTGLRHPARPPRRHWFRGREDQLPHALAKPFESGSAISASAAA